MRYEASPEPPQVQVNLQVRPNPAVNTIHNAAKAGPLKFGTKNSTSIRPVPRVHARTHAQSTDISALPIDCPPHSPMSRGTDGKGRRRRAQRPEGQPTRPVLRLLFHLLLQGSSMLVRRPRPMNPIIRSIPLFFIILDYVSGFLFHPESELSSSPCSYLLILHHLLSYKFV